MIDFENTPGDTFWMVADKAINVSVQADQPVRVVFNEIELTVSPKDTGDLVWQRYMTAYDKLCEAYQASPEGIAAAERARTEVEMAQAKHDQLMESLPEIAGDEAALMNWLVLYSDAADHIHVRKDFPRVWSMLEVHGYQDNDAVGLDEQAYKNKRVMARYIVGQAINCMKNINKGPHPITEKMVTEYNQLVEEIDHGS
jgi:hypothetical protein